VGLEIKGVALKGQGGGRMGDEREGEERLWILEPNGPTYIFTNEA
jgi:hypothetical protein